MINSIEYISGALLTSVVNIYISSVFVKIKLDWKKLRLYFSLLFYTVVLLLTYSNTNMFVKVIINYLGLVVGNQVVFEKKINKTAVVTLITFGIVALSEILYTVLIVGIMHVDVELLKKTYFVSLATNIGISLISILLIHIPIVKLFFTEKVSNIDTKKGSPTILLSILTITFLSLVVYYIYFSASLIYTLIISTTLILIFLFIIFKLINEMNESIKKQVKYEITAKSLKDYEEMLSIQYKRNHENDNNLISIKGLIDKNNNDAVGFIESIIKDKRNDDQYLMLKVSSIPTGGLQGLIYQKLLVMKSKMIDINVEVSKELNGINFDNLCVNKIKDICMIVGIFLDNSIQAIDNCDKKMIGIYLYIEEDQLIIMISNNYENNFDIHQLDKAGYTTKSDGHGYGLSLVNDILKKDADFINTRMINGDIFSQILKVKIGNNC